MRKKRNASGGAVMTLQHTRRVLRGLLIRGARDHFDFAKQVAQRLQRNRAWTQQAGAAWD